MPHGWIHLTVGGPEVGVDIEIEQPPQNGNVGGCVARTRIPTGSG